MCPLPWQLGVRIRVLLERHPADPLLGTLRLQLTLKVPSLHGLSSLTTTCSPYYLLYYRH